MTRREALRAALAGCGALLLPTPAPAHPRVRGVDPLRLALVLPADAERTPAMASALRGVTLGVEEAARTAALLGRAVELSTVPPQAVPGGGAAEALLGGFDEADCLRLAAQAEAAGLPFLNLGCASAAVRRACHRTTFHVEASAAMYADALARHDATEGVRAALWHPALERFGAAQLNDRYRARFQGEMDGPAWAGWMAVKVLWEAALRARSGEPGALIGYLRHPSTRFDGHKGWPLSFRPGDHQLRQPLYLVAASGGETRVVGEVPVRPAGGGTSSSELLDRLGAGASTSTCPGNPAGTP